MLGISQFLCKRKLWFARHMMLLRSARCENLCWIASCCTAHTGVRIVPQRQTQLFLFLIDLHGYRLGRIVVLFVALLLVLAQRVDQVDPAHSARPFTSTQKKSRPPLSAKGRRVVVEMSVIKPIGTQAPRTSRRLALCRIFCAKSSPIPLANSGATRSTSSCG